MDSKELCFRGRYAMGEADQKQYDEYALTKLGRKQSMITGEYLRKKYANERLSHSKRGYILLVG